MFVSGFRKREINAAINRSASASEDLRRIRALRSDLYERRALEKEHAQAQAEVRRIQEAMQADQNRPSHEDQLDMALKAAAAIANQLKGFEPDCEAGSKKKKETAQ
jgi:hypothetical protein